MVMQGENILKNYIFGRKTVRVVCVILSVVVIGGGMIWIGVS